MILGLALYLIAAARWSAWLREKAVSKQRLKVYGFLVAAVPLGAGAYSLFDNQSSVDWKAFSLAFEAVIAVLGYVTVVYSPKWIVGKYGRTTAQEKTDEAAKWARGNMND